jgi:hypothetical protein
VQLPTPSFPPAAIAAASHISTQAELNSASPLIREVVQTPAYATVTATSSLEAASTAVPKADKVVGVVAAASFPIIGPPGCYWVSAAENLYNSVGFRLMSVGVEDHNWCFVQNLYGYWVIYSTPWSSFYQSSAWGYVNCGLQNQYQGWQVTNQEWIAGVVGNFGLANCVYVEFHPSVWLDIYGNGVYFNGGSNS